MVVMRGHLGAAGWRAAEALDDEAVAIVPGLDAAGGKARKDGGEAVALLDAKRAEAVHHGTALGEGGGDGEDRIFVDHGRGALGRHTDAAKRDRKSTRLNSSHYCASRMQTSG